MSILTASGRGTPDAGNRWGADDRPDHVTERDSSRILAPDGRLSQNAYNWDTDEKSTTQRPSKSATSTLTPPSSTKRDTRLDFLRGFAVLVMVIDHVAGPSPLHLLTGGNRFFVSAAEGFIFISGFLVGIVYGAKARRHGWPVAARQALGRAFTLYAVSVWLTLAFAILSATFGLWWAPDSHQTTIGRFLLEIMTFQRAFYLVDVMQLYALLLAVTPPALWLLHRGHWQWLLALSFGVWLTFQFSGGQFHLPWLIQNNPVFAFASWQLLFFSAMVLGYERGMFQRIWTRWTRSIHVHLPGGWIPVLAVLVGFMIWLNMTNGAALRGLSLVTDPTTALDAWFDKTRLPPLRLLASAIVFAFAWSLVDRYWEILARVSGWLLLPIGTRALSAYVTHVLIVAVMGAVVIKSGTVTTPMSQPDWSVQALNTVSQIVAVLAIWIIVPSRFLSRMVAWLGQPPTRVVQHAADSKPGRRWRVSPSLGALAALAVGSVVALATPWPSGLPYTWEQPREPAHTAVPRIEAPATVQQGMAGIRTDPDIDSPSRRDP